MSESPQALRVGFVGLGNMGAPDGRATSPGPGFALTVRDANDALQAQIAAEVGAAEAVVELRLRRTWTSS